MKFVPFSGALALLYTCLAPCHAQDLQPHQEAAKQIDACLTVADGRIAILAEQLRQLKTQRHKLTTLEDALSKVTRQKSDLEAELLASQKADRGNPDLEHALADARKTTTAYREETERLRQNVTRLTQSESDTESNKAALTAALSQLEQERKTVQGFTSEKAIRESEIAATSKELLSLREKLSKAQDTSSLLAPLRQQLKQSSGDFTTYKLQQERRQSGLEAAQKKRLQELALANDELVKAKNQLTLASNSNAEQAAQLRKLAEVEKALKAEQARAARADQLENDLTLAQTQERETTQALKDVQQKYANLLASQSTKDNKAAEYLKALGIEKAKAIRASQFESELGFAKNQQQQTTQALEDAKRQYAALISTQSAKDAKLADYQKALEAEKAKVIQASKFESDLGLAKNQQQQTTQALEEAKRQYATLSGTQSAKDAKLAEYQKALEAEKAKAARASKLESDLALAKKQQEDADQALEAAKKQNATQLADQSTNATRLAAIQKELDAEKAKAARAAQLASDLALAQKQQQETARALEAAKKQNATQLADQSTNATRLAAIQQALDAEKAKAARAAELERQLAAIQAKAAADQAVLTKLQGTTQASEIQIASLTLAQTKKATEAKSALANLESQLSARDAELAKLRASLSQKEKTWQQNRTTFKTDQEKIQQELVGLRQAQTVMQGDFLRIDPIRYALNSSQIDEEQARVLTQAQKILRVYPKASFEISGHTCTLGSDERNQTLSEQRAKRLLDFLATKGVAQKQLSSAGFGETKPIANNSTDAGRRVNRRVEIRVKSADGRTLLDTEDRP